MDRLEIALKLAGRGFRVFPQDRSKRPCIKEWPERATTDAGQIRRWGTQFPSANWATATGEGSRILVLDVDVKNGQPGAENLKQLESDCGPIATMRCRTPSGGWHLYFRYPTGENIRNGQLTKYPGIEIKGNGGGVTLPGSFYASGAEYRLEVAEPLAQLPGSLLSLLKNGHSHKAEDEHKPDESKDLSAVWRAWVTENFPEAKWTGNEAQVSCPFHDDQTPSCSINVVKARFYCHAAGCGAHGGLPRLALRKGVPAPAEAVPPVILKKPTQAQILVQLSADMELFACDSVAYATFPVDKHRETWPVRTQSFSDILAHRYFLKTKEVPNGESLESAIGVLRGKALWEGEQIPVHVRVAGDNTRMYLDLGDPEWQAVEVTADGWRVVETPQAVRFRRPKGLQELPKPVHGGDILDLVPFLNCASPDDIQLILAWLVAALRPSAKYPVLGLNGEQGSGKSTLARRLRELLDPNMAMLRASPREEDDLLIAAHNGWLINLDNVSHLQPWLLDGICRLSTGAGWAKRQLYTDAEETIFQASRPVVINGIADLFHRGDLLDRSIIVTLPGISETARRLDKDLDAEFAEKRPGILGGLLDAVSSAMRALPGTKIEDPPRMADFAHWVAAAAPALQTTPEAFLRAYRENRELADQLVIEGSLVAQAVIAFIAKWEGGAWRGTARTLLECLTLEMGPEGAKAREWVKTPRALSGELRRVAPAIRKRRVDVYFDPREKDERPIRIEKRRAP